jgi:hypothetical protein
MSLKRSRETDFKECARFDAKDCPSPFSEVNSNSRPEISYRALDRWRKIETKKLEGEIATAVVSMPIELAGIMAVYGMDWEIGHVDVSRFQSGPSTRMDGWKVHASIPYDNHRWTCSAVNKVVDTQWCVFPIDTNVSGYRHSGTGVSLCIKGRLECRCENSGEEIVVKDDELFEFAEHGSYGWTEAEVNSAQLRKDLTFECMVVMDIVHRDLMKDFSQTVWDDEAGWCGPFPIGNGIGAVQRALDFGVYK